MPRSATGGSPGPLLYGLAGKPLRGEKPERMAGDSRESQIGQNLPHDAGKLESMAGKSSGDRHPGMLRMQSYCEMPIGRHRV